MFPYGHRTRYRNTYTEKDTLMSRGQGRIERAILDLFDKHPEGAWTTEDLCRLIYPTANRAEKKHRVAVLRAVKTIMDKADNQYRYWVWSRGGTIGGTRVLFNCANVMSFGLGYLKRHNTRRWDGIDWVPDSEEELLERLQPGGDDHRNVVPGGIWDQAVKIWTAHRDDDQKIAEKVAANIRLK